MRDIVPHPGDCAAPYIAFDVIVIVWTNVVAKVVRFTEYTSPPLAFEFMRYKLLLYWNKPKAELKLIIFSFQRVPVEVNSPI